MIKPVVAADALVIGCFLLYQGWMSKSLIKAIVQRCVPLTVGFFIPLALTLLYFETNGLLEQFLYFTFEMPGRYSRSVQWWEPILFMLDFLGRFFPFTILAVFAFSEPLDRDRLWQRFCLFWFAIVTVIILLQGHTYEHYQIQLMPALVCLFATWWDPERQSLTRLRSWLARHGQTALIVLVTGLTAGLAYYYLLVHPDPNRAIAAQLRQEIGEDETLYTADTDHIMYHLLDKRSPSPYVHWTVSFADHHIEAYSINLDSLADVIYDIKQPDVVLSQVDPEFPENPLVARIPEYYRVVDTLQELVVVWRRETN